MSSFDIGGARLDAPALKAALLGLCRETAPWLVRDGAAESTDLVVEWRVTDPRWSEIFAKAALGRVSRIHLRLDEGSRAIRAWEEDIAIEWQGGNARLFPVAGGPKPARPDWAYGGPVGFSEQIRPGVVHSYLFTAAELRGPIAAAATEYGWRLETTPSQADVRRAGGSIPAAAWAAPSSPPAADPIAAAPLGGAASPWAQPSPSQGALVPSPGAYVASSGTVLPGRSPNTIIQPKNPMAVAGFVCGLHGLVPLWIGFILCILAIIFSSIGLSRSKELQGVGRGLAIAGLVLGLVFFIPAMFGL